MSSSINRRDFFQRSGKAACLCTASGFVAGMTATNASATENKEEKPLPPVSYCGLYCGACPLYLMSINESDPTKQKCLGCKSDKLAPHCQECVIKDCAREKGVEACGQCESFPCEKTKGFHENMGPMGQVAERNSVAIQVCGLTPLWSRLQQCRYTCEKCGKAFSIKDEKCPHCEADLYSASEEAANYTEGKKG